MNVRSKARRPLGLLVSVAAIAFFFVTASPASAQDSADHNENNHEHDDYSASVHGDCEGGFAVTIKNDTHHDVWALIRLNGVDTIVKVNDDSSKTVQPLDLNEDIPNTILVKIGEKILLQKTFSVNCLPDPASKLSASISSDCGNFVVTIKNDGDADGTATVTVNGSSVNLDVAAGKTVTMTIAITEDADNSIAVTAGQTDLAHKTFHVNCKEDIPTPTTTLIPPTTTAPQAPAPEVQVLGQAVEQPQTLAFTGRNTLVEAMIGIAMLGFGLQLMRSSRRLEQS